MTGNARRAVETAGVLLALERRRAALVEQLGWAVEAAVEEQRRPDDPPGRWEARWWADLPGWWRLPESIDRLRRAHDDLLVVGAQEAEVCELLVAGRVAPGVALGRMNGFAGRRQPLLGQVFNARRCLREEAGGRPALTPAVSRQILVAWQGLRRAEDEGLSARSWLEGDEGLWERTG